MSNAGASLGRLTILITRPQHQAERTAATLMRHGAQPIIFPTLATEAVVAGSPEAMTLNETMRKLPETNWLIFVSANAVEFGWPWILREGNLPTSAQIAAIGQATALALKAQGVESVLVPESGNDSEALLALPAFAVEGAVKGMRVIIFRGKSETGGRTFLGDNLRERGAVVCMAECYSRSTAKVSPDAAMTLWSALRAGQIDVINVQSVETFDGLVTILQQTGSTAAEVINVLQHCVMLVPHRRIAAALTVAGLKQVQVSGVGDEALCQSLEELKHRNGN